jgi:hypothetical protein
VPRKFSPRRRSSAAATLADHLLPEGLDRFVIRARVEGRSWRWVAEELNRRTDGVVDISYETVRDWFPEDRRDPDPGSEDEEPAA